MRNIWLKWFPWVFILWYYFSPNFIFLQSQRPEDLYKVSIFWIINIIKIYPLARNILWSNRRRNKDISTKEDAGNQESEAKLKEIPENLGHYFWGCVQGNWSVGYWLILTPRICLSQSKCHPSSSPGSNLTSRGGSFHLHWVLFTGPLLRLSCVFSSLQKVSPKNHYASLAGVLSLKAKGTSMSLFLLPQTWLQLFPEITKE